MRVDAKLQLSGDARLAGVGARAAGLEADGYDGLWTSEAAHDPFLPVALAAQTTEHVTLGTGIAVAFARTPMTVAYLANDLQLLSAGRFVLGLGSQVKPHVQRRFSMPWSSPAARMREFVVALRAIWACWQTGEPLQHDGEFYTHTLMTPYFSPGPNPFGTPPVHLAAVGELMTQVAGEVADGLLLHAFTTGRYLVERTLPALERGAASAGRSRGDLEVSYPCLIATGTTEQEMSTALAAVRNQVAFYASTPAYRRRPRAARLGRPRRRAQRPVGLRPRRPLAGDGAARRRQRSRGVRRGGPTAGRRGRPDVALRRSRRPHHLLRPVRRGPRRLAAGSRAAPRGAGDHRKQALSMAVDEASELLRAADVPVLRPRRALPAKALRSRLLLLGPAFVAAVAYIDPGNFATNFAAGGIAGYALVWVVVAANVVAVLVQSLSAKLGLATGRDLAELCRDRYPAGVVRLLWAQAELVVMATDVAEVIGGAIALQILFGMPLLLGGLVTGAVAFALLGLQLAGYRRFELVVAGLLAVVVVGIGYVALGARIDAVPLAQGFVPRWPHGAVGVVATGILGATVMPHVIYLHSALVAQRPGRPAADAREGGTAARRHALRFQRIDIGLALGVAGLVNLAMLVAAAALLGGSSVEADLTSVAGGLNAAVGGAAATAFAVALLASGFASSGVGTFAGQVVMQGFLRRTVPVRVRRSVTLLPALVVLVLGVDPTRALVVSQVVLSFGIPFALVPLVHLTARRELMGTLVNRRLTTMTAAGVGAAIIAVNGGLVVATLGPVLAW